MSFVCIHDYQVWNFHEKLFTTYLPGLIYKTELSGKAKVYPVTLQLSMKFLYVWNSCEDIPFVSYIIGEKARWELHNDVACCFKLILETAPHKTAAIWPLASNLTNHPSKMKKTCQTMLEKQGQIH